MKLSLKKALAALGVVACVAAPTFADTVVYGPMSRFSTS